jgi:hypothetical protein
MPRRSQPQRGNLSRRALPAAAGVALIAAAVVVGLQLDGQTPAPRNTRRPAIGGVVMAGRARSALSSPTTRVLAAHPLAAGAPGPGVACATMLSPGADIEAALVKALPRAVVCLEAGPWGPITLTDVAHAGNVTLAAAPGAHVHLAGLTIAGQGDTRSDTRDLTIQGFWIDRGVQDLTDSSGGLTFQFDTIQRVRQGYGFYFDADGNGGSHFQTGVTMLHNRIDHVGECLAVVGGTASDFTFNDNVCGPGLGYGDTESTQPGHYMEIGGIRGMIADHNEFRGPADPNIARAGLHLNVLHIFGGASDVEFSGNVLWHTDARGQALLLQEGHFDNVRIDDNLDVEDPACRAEGSPCPNYMIEAAGTHGLSFEHNTIVGAYWGVLLTASNENGDYSSGTDYTISHNVVVGSLGGSDISYGGCAKNCSFAYNVTDDGSAEQAGAQHSFAHWVPAWRNGHYEAAGLPFRAGYFPAGR